MEVKHMGIKGYKAFGKELICNPDGIAKQYKEHTTFEEDGDVDLGPCRKGVMHFCEDPFDVLRAYPLVNSDGEITEFAEVEAVGDVLNYKNQSITNKLHIGAKLNLKGFVKACVDFTIEKTKFEIDKDSDSDISSGDSAKIGSSGYSAQIGSSGYSAQIGSSGDYAQIGSSGGSAKIGSSGGSAQIGSSGYSAKIGSSGDSAKIGSSGGSAQIGSSGDYAQITSEGKNSVVMAAGFDSMAKAKIGSWITLAEWVKVNDDKTIWKPKCVKTEYVDGEKIKEDTFYKLIDGEFKEVKEND
jgi:hypothetical protein